MTQILTLRRFDDMHMHVRTGDLLRAVLPFTMRYASRAVVMPNTRPRAILTGEDVMWYRDEIQRVYDSALWQYPFEPLMTFEVRDSTTPEICASARKAGAVAGKVYPLGVTTNSDEGLRDFEGRNFSETLRAMADTGTRLLLHGECDQARTLVTKREHAFLPILRKLVDRHPDLKIVLEHISTQAAVECVQELGENVAATITAHHLCLTLNDVIGDGIRPHHGCMPMPKDFDDRDALIAAATSGNPKFFLGSDSAPHVRYKKECVKGACGVYSAPVLPQVLAEVFEQAGRLEALEDFTSRFGAEFYGLPLNAGTITLFKSEWTMLREIDGIVPFRAETKLQWQLE
ncbi:MAG: dihydroorotase [Patescibacteria group bacterium]